jgi:hypothetical protein
MTEHKIYTYPEDKDERCYWICSCGHSGSAAAWKADLASDKHIKYDEGDGRTDTNKPF